MKRILFSTILSFLTLTGFAQVDLSYYLPKGYTYNPAIPTPEQVLGYQVGDWHVTHDQLVMYMKAVAAASDRVIIQETGRTYDDQLSGKPCKTGSDQGRSSEATRSEFFFGYRKNACGDVYGIFCPWK
jgi:hypothetical protein